MERNKIYRFLGVSTKKSLVNVAFPRWMDVLDCDVTLETFDLPLGAGKESYVEFCKGLRSSHCVGALVTSHKTEIFEQCFEFFLRISSKASRLREISAIRRSDLDGELYGHNTDVEGALRSLVFLTNKNPSWLGGDRNIVILGAGGACVSLLRCAQEHVIEFGSIFVTEKNERRVCEVNEIFDEVGLLARVVRTDVADDVIAKSGQAPLVINATGVGKDLPGKLVNDISCFPVRSTFWDLNYRGERELFHELKRLSDRKEFIVEDGWKFFVDGWINNIKYVLDISISDNKLVELRNVVHDLQTC